MLKQGLKLSQNLNALQINSINFLTTKKMDLAELILSESEHNEYLEIDENKIFFQTLKTYRFKKFFYQANEKTPYEIALEKKEAKSSLKEHLKFQLRVQKLSQNEIKIGEILINNLDYKGFHILNPYDLFKTEERGIVEKILKLIQQFDPIGICVFNIIESLILQANYYDLGELVINILKNSDLLEKNQEKLRTVLKISNDEFAEAIKTIRLKLNPNPTFEFKDSNENYYIEPDIVITRDDNKFKVNVREVEIFKKITIKDGIKNKVKYKKAKWLIEALRFRDEVLAKIGIAIYIFQKEFFKRGFRHLRPMTLSHISKKIEVSKSTISRAIRQKYIKCEWGIIPLKKLFNEAGGAKTNEFSKISIKLLIKNITEDNTGISDSKISDILKAKGISISRRTVNKYKNELKYEGGLYGA